MAEDHSIFDYLGEAFDESYDFVRESFLEVNSTPEEAAKARAGLQKMTDGNYEAFRALAARKADDGNNIPIIMATIRSKNLARKIISTVVSGAMEQEALDDVSADVAATLLSECMGPLNVLMWDKYMGEKFEDELKGV